MQTKKLPFHIRLWNTVKGLKKMPGSYRALRSEFPEPLPGLHPLISDGIESRGKRLFREDCERRDGWFKNEYLISFESFENWYKFWRNSLNLLKIVLSSTLFWAILAGVTGVIQIIK